MIIALPLENEKELSFDFSKSKKIAIYNVADRTTELITTDTSLLLDEKNSLVSFLKGHQVSVVVSPYYHFETLKNLKLHGIEALQSQDRQLAQNIECCLSKSLPHFDVSESFIVDSCGTTCAECTLPCKG